MSFLNNLAEQYMHQGQGGPPPQQQRPQQGPSSGQHYGSERPNPPAPWVAEWEPRDNRWLFVNRQTGERTFNYPQAGGGRSPYPGPPQGYGQGSSQYPPRPQGYGGPPGPSGPQGPPGPPRGPGYGPPPGQYGSPQGPPGGYNARPGPPQQAQQPSHTGRNTALAAVAGLAGGALLMHEGHKIEERWEGDKYRAEERAEERMDNERLRTEEQELRMRERFDQDEYRMREGYDRDEYRMQEGYDRDVYRERDNYDDGRYVVEERIIEDDRYRGDTFGDDAAYWAGRETQRVEDIPDDVAYEAGRVEGDIDRFEDRVEDDFDAGRDDARYEDDGRW